MVSTALVEWHSADSSEPGDDPRPMASPVEGVVARILGYRLPDLDAQLAESSALLADENLLIAESNRAAFVETLPED
ncbi:MAG: hypothetical protein ACFCVC_18125 [Acidimicrobiia bacterium]|jgi:hypothetical protein